MSSGRIVFLLSSPRVAPGLLAWPAWEALQAATVVLTGSPDHSQRAALEAAGVRVEDATGHASRASRPDPARGAALSGAGGQETGGHGTGGHERDDARLIARELVDRAASGDLVVWLAAEDGDAELAGALALVLAERSDLGATELPELEVMLGAYDLPGARLLDLVAVMDRLRRECPWVQEQTHRTLVRYLVEEAYETVEAIETGDRTHLREELGDLLFQAVFHSRLAQEEEPSWSIDEVAADLTDKLIRRNPHVFGPHPASVVAAAGAGAAGTAGNAGAAAAGSAGGAGTAADAPGARAIGLGAVDTGGTEPGSGLSVAEIESNWDDLKAAEKSRSSAVEGVPLALPALALADKLLERTAKAGMEIELPALHEGAPHANESDDRGPRHIQGERRTAETIGRALFGLAQAAYAEGIDPEQALRDTLRTYIARIRAAESSGQ